jgi:hypothetical protein
VGGATCAATRTLRAGGFTTWVVQPQCGSIPSRPWSVPWSPASRQPCVRRGNAACMGAGGHKRVTPSRAMRPAGGTFTGSTRPWVSTSRCRFRPLSCLAPSSPRSPPTPVVLTLWRSRIPARGWASRPQGHPQAFAPPLVKPLPRPSVAPRPQGVIRRRPVWEVRRQEAPLAARPPPREDGMEDGAPCGLPWPPRFGRGWQPGHDAGPLSVRQLCRLR